MGCYVHPKLSALLLKFSYGVSCVLSIDTKFCYNVDGSLYGSLPRGHFNSIKRLSNASRSIRTGCRSARTRSLCLSIGFPLWLQHKLYRFVSIGLCSAWEQKLLYCHISVSLLCWITGLLSCGPGVLQGAILVSLASTILRSSIQILFLKNTAKIPVRAADLFTSLHIFSCG